MRSTNLYSASAAFLALAALAAPVSATTFCVTAGPGGPTQLDNAMRYWVHASDETVYIHLEQGTYTQLTTSPEYFQGYTAYDQTGTSDGEDQLGNASLHLVGGFVPGTNPTCSKRSVDPANTIISGSAGGYNSELFIQQQEGEMLVDGITFTQFGNGVQLNTISDSTMTVRNVAAIGNGNGNLNYPALGIDISSATVLGGGTGVVRVENCLIAHNNTHGLEFTDDTDSDSIQVLGCTMADNSGYGLAVGDPNNDYYILNGALKTLNTIFRNNTLADVFVQNGGHKPTIKYSNVASITGLGATTSNLQNTDPHFVDAANSKYQLQSDSPFINIGAAPSLVTGGTYAGTDIRGRTRVIGSHVDFGPYETLIDDTAAQSVELLADTPTGKTLRAAITTANSNANPTTIVFNVTTDGGCPHYIELGSLLPDITSDITIDGFSQAGASPNSIVPGYDGMICMILRGGGLDHAFKTSGGGRLTVRGIEFEDFSTAAIRLSSGSGHVVVGNGFSAEPGQTLTNKSGVLIEGSASSSQIGSYAFGDRNVFVQSTDAAVKIASNGVGNHVIQGNYFGFNYDGTKRAGNQNKWGVYALDSGGNEISYNYFGSTALDAIHLSGAATSFNHIVENSIGTAPADGAAAGGGYGTCNPICLGLFPAIDILSGAHDNYVGAVGAGGGNNFIVNEDGPGVWVEATAGAGNRIYGSNLIHDNNGFLPVDLGTQGPTLNDVGDGDSGGNKLQNYPTLSQAMRIEANVVRLSGSLVAQTGVAAQSYRVDVYWTDTCLFSGGGSDTPRGDMKRYVGFMNVFSDGTAFNVPYSNMDIQAAPGLTTPGYLFAIATDAAGNTSEPGPCRTFVNDYIFTDGFK